MSIGCKLFYFVKSTKNLSNLNRLSAKIEAKDVEIDFPVYSETSRSLSRQLVGKFRNRVEQRSGRTIVHALRGINICIHEGERVGLLGPNGAGKSTLLRVFSLIYPPSSGKIEVTGKISSLLNISLGVEPELTGRENLMIRGIMLGLTPGETQNLLPGVISFADLEEFIDLPVRTYSDGMKLRLLFSMATATNSDILLMDEWLSAGDKSFHNKAADRMQAMVEKAGILVLASHSVGLLKKTCTRGILLQKGEVLLDGPIDEVCEFYKDQ